MSRTAVIARAHSYFDTGQFLADLRLKHGPGDTVKLTVLRGKEKKEISGTMW